MSTRSRIAIENQDGTVRSIYCHFDGYPEHNGAVLFENYKTQEKVESLVSLGAISFLQEEIEIPKGVKHNFQNQVKGITVAYHRDRGEDLSIEEHENVEDFIRGDVEEYGYIFTAAGEWLFVDGHTNASRRKSKTLESVLKSEGVL